MKHAENNEIELLLRDLGKNEGEGNVRSARAGAGSPDDPMAAHLDPDELNSFAEGVLPAATRMLYTAHLADCVPCRKIVAQLAMASGLSVQQIQTEKAPKGNLWRYFASIFTPSVMRYAVPALSLVILAAIGLVWFRQERQSSFVARNGELTTTQKSEPFGGDQKAPTPEQSNAKPAVAEGSQGRRAGTKTGDTGQEEERSKTEKNEGAGLNSRTKVDAETNSEVSKETESRVARTPKLNVDAPPPAKPQGEFAQNREALAKRPAEPTSANSVAQSEDDKRKRSDQDEAASKKAEVRDAPAPVALGGIMARKDVGRSATRTVAGRRFRREDNVWVDTTYSPSASTTNITRGSEQYRALVGDEPGLRTIAEQLDGEIVVVWKGKAYRIR